MIEKKVYSFRRILVTILENNCIIYNESEKSKNTARIRHIGIKQIFPVNIINM